MSISLRQFLSSKNYPSEFHHTLPSPHQKSHKIPHNPCPENRHTPNQKQITFPPGNTAFVAPMINVSRTPFTRAEKRARLVAPSHFKMQTHLSNINKLDIKEGSVITKLGAARSPSLANSPPMTSQVFFLPNHKKESDFASFLRASFWDTWLPWWMVSLGVSYPRDPSREPARQRISDVSIPGKPRFSHAPGNRFSSDNERLKL